MALIFNELPTAFVWYDKKEKQQRFRENATKSVDYKLICPDNALLPFQLKINNGLPAPTAWELFTSCDVAAATITGYINQIHARQVDTGTYAYYNGNAIQFTLPGGAIVAHMPEGCYYAVLTFAGGVKYYSEVFNVKADLSTYTKIQFSNTCDLNPLLYKNITWGQVIYLDTFIHASEPTIEEEGERDGDDQLITNFAKLVVKYRFSVLVPDYMKIALTALQMHDTITLTTESGIRTGVIEKITVSSTIETGGAYSTVDVVMEQLIMTKEACCQEIATVVANPWA